MPTEDGRYNDSLVALNLSSNALYHRVHMHEDGSHAMLEEPRGIQVRFASNRRRRPRGTPTGSA